MFFYLVADVNLMGFMAEFIDCYFGFLFSAGQFISDVVDFLEAGAGDEEGVVCGQRGEVGSVLWIEWPLVQRVISRTGTPLH